ncbi:hypothetical protein Cob_v000818 [Colletotrichum orbiculare MAFF 240422]|uniref:Uncharacterized protein n=1 Tax=Colletotrichum orbiculare (strain 104-T / ATCC 96160 / CBS 514.97 / LARS 414 / MAFF 240422) TaxID=1213857 RepID=N4VA88_COLOR|nr:hypothetical protein Cob_v000818 [Colletotrichum orbiculare MAFF 240422]
MRFSILATTFVALHLLEGAASGVIPGSSRVDDSTIDARSPSAPSHPKTHEPRGWLKNPFKGKKGPSSSSQPAAAASDSDSDSDSEPPAAATSSQADGGRVPDIQDRGYTFRAVRSGNDMITVEVGRANPSSWQGAPPTMTVVDKFEVHPSENEIKVINAENDHDPTPAALKARFRTILMATWKEYSGKYVSELKYITYSMDDAGTNQLVVDREDEGTDERKAFNWLVNQNPLGRVVAGIPSTFTAMDDKQVDRVVVWAEAATWGPAHLASQFRSWHMRFRYRDT